MDDQRYPHAIRRAFERFTMSAELTVPESVRASVRLERTAFGRPSLRGRLQRLALPVSVAAVAAVLALTALAPARPAFAGWSAVPTAADPAAVAAAVETCRQTEPHLAGLKVAGSEQRGAYTMVVFNGAEDRSFGLCVTGEGIKTLVLAGAAPSSGVVDAPLTDDGRVRPLVTEEDHGTPSSTDLPPVHYLAMPAADHPAAQQVQAFVMGISPAVARVVVERAGAEPVVATVLDGGIAVVWWPAGPTAGDIVASDAAGNVLDRLPADMTLH